MFSKVKLLHRLHFFEIISLRTESTSGLQEIYSPLFFDKRVQELLKKMTNIDLEKVFEPKPFGKEVNAPKYKFMTTSQLNEEMEKIRKEGDRLLQIPPLINPKEYEPEILRNDTSLDGYDSEHSKHIFVDISFDVPNEERQAVVREPNGILRTASRSEKYRINQIYNPLEGREIEMPKMFEDEYLKNVLDRGDYVFILDRACAQFDPDDPMYHKVIKVTYDAINERHHFSQLYSTRHFGSFVFYLVTHKRIDDLLLYNLQSARIEDAQNLIEVYHIIHPTCASAKSRDTKNEIEKIKAFIEMDSKKKDLLELSLQNYLNIREEQKQLEIGLQKAHGL